MKRLNQSMQDVNEGKSNSSISLEEADNINRQAVAEENAKNYGRAFDLYLKAAKAGSIWAMRNLGYVYKNGSGTQKDDRAAFEWFKKAAEHADVNLEAATDAMFQVGIYYYRGEVTPKDVVKSFSWCKKAAENGVVNAMNWVGDFYHDGEGVMQNYDEAVRWYQKAATQGNIYAKITLGFLYAKGTTNIKRNPDKAIKCIEDAISTARSNEDSGHYRQAVEALYNLAILFNEQHKKWKEKSIEIGPKVSYEFMKLYDYKLSEWDLYNKYLDLIKRAAELGSSSAKDECDKVWNSDSCFITTAVCDNFGKSDDCYELTTFRNFRDKWLINQSDGKSLIDKYYDIAPKIVSKINQLQNSNEIYKSIWSEYLKPCLKFIEDGKYQDCKNLYIKMVNVLQKSFLK